MTWFRLCNAAFAVVLVGCGHEIISVDEIIEKNTDAMGGAAAIEAIHSVAIKLHITDPSFEVDGVYRAARPGRMRMDGCLCSRQTCCRKRSTASARGNGRAKANRWQRTRKPPRPCVTAWNCREIFSVCTSYDDAAIKSLSRVGKKVGSVSHYLLRITLSDGYSTTLYVDPVTWLITRRRDVRPLHPDIDPKPTTIESVKTDFRKIGGVGFSFHNTDIDLGNGQIIGNGGGKRSRGKPKGSSHNLR